MTTKQEHSELRKGDLFLVDFGNRNRDYIKSSYYKYRGFWMEISEEPKRKPDALYFKAVCRERDNRAMAGKRDFDWDSGAELNWRRGSDFTKSRRMPRTPETPISARQTLPNI